MSEPTRIGVLGRADLRRCAELERILFPDDDPWSESAFASELDWGHYYVGAYAGELLVGYGGLGMAGKPGDMEASVHNLGVDPVWQGRGVGRALLRVLLARADEHLAQVFLEVRTDNAPAIGLYEAHGFATIGLRRRYYQPSGADAYTMVRPARVDRTVENTP
ncbi:ribosomal protein S18-alanine N-acetyltransferase [Actinokineospora auranticolor]|uniref:Ribosomal-protein-alanine N-acetyltransferase n=1 Tax=Actinokineospora auranticolor TaxID=155976 RepID=A0A2S6GWP3_9PSEU|nr:ribosomal protein S18-alanine N-acetyltransferase [Actinokineospora auranticolor]PPK69600.1 ribosomal-protein-alanine N-acetyltransferase [Actinokineospora auranticolor]